MRRNTLRYCALPLGRDQYDEILDYHTCVGAPSRPHEPAKAMIPINGATKAMSNGTRRANTMQRITITLDDHLVEQFETFLAQQGYRNRSEAFRDMVRERLAAERLAQPESGHCLANLTYVYDHHERDLAARMTQVQHDHHDLTVSTLHVHLDHDNCMETVVLRGPVERVREFANTVIAQPGVRHAKLQILPVSVHEALHGHGGEHGSRRHLHVEPMT